MTLTLHDIKVWNTGEVIDLVVPSDTDASVDASAMTIAPGFEDPHVHFRDPGQTYKESMISGCAAGIRAHPRCLMPDMTLSLITCSITNPLTM